MKLKYVKLFLKVIFSLLFILGGVAHFTNSSFYLPMMPKSLPFPLELVYISGVIEIALGVGLLIPRLSKYSAFGLILLLLAVFPANINMYLNAEDFPDATETALLVRLPIQLLLIIWAYLYTKKIARSKILECSSYDSVQAVRKYSCGSND